MRRRHSFALLLCALSASSITMAADRVVDVFGSSDSSIGSPVENTPADNAFGTPGNSGKSAAKYATKKVPLPSNGPFDVFGSSDLPALQSQADEGNSDAQYELGMRYYRGNGVQQDKQEMLEWVQKAAEQGNSSAELTLGEAYRKGIGTQKNIEEGMKWIRKSAEDGNVNAEIRLGKLYRTGNGVPENKVEANKWYQKAQEYFAHKDEESDKQDKQDERQTTSERNAPADVLYFRCELLDDKGRNRMLLVDVDRAGHKVTERPLNPHVDSDEHPEVYLDHRMTRTSTPDGNRFRLDNMEFTTVGADIYQIEYGYSSYTAGTEGYLARITMKPNDITFAHLTGGEEHPQENHCVSVSASKVKRFLAAEADRMKEAQIDSDAPASQEGR